MWKLASGSRPRYTPTATCWLRRCSTAPPHFHRHKKLRIKLTANHVEILLNLERLAIHPRSRHRDGRRIKIDAHFPPASQPHYEATPQRLLSQSRFIHPELHRLFVELFNADVSEHGLATLRRSLRRPPDYADFRAQHPLPEAENGLVRSA
jgi:hypothetical protein